jgi:diguanylate cyclase
VCLALLDIDHFTTVNDTFGHQTGDQVIRFVASLISRDGAPKRFAARFGGDEFAMIFVGAPAADVDAALRQVLHDVSDRSLKRRSTSEPLGDITLSIGFAERRTGETLVSLMERADAALYDSKRGGRNRITGPATPKPASMVDRMLRRVRPVAPATVARSWG